MMKINKRRWGLEWGITLLFTALPGSQIIKLLLKTNKYDFTSIFLIVGLICIVNIHNLIKGYLPTFNKTTFLLLAFQMYTIMLAWVRGIGLFTANYGSIYIIYTSLLILAFSTNKREINAAVLIRNFIYTAGLLNVLLLYYLSDGFSSNLIYINKIYTDSGILIADRLTLSTVAYGYLIAFLVYSPNEKKNKIFKYIFSIFAILNILSTTRRGLMVSFLFILLLHLTYKQNIVVNRKYNMVKVVSKAFGIMFIIIGGIILVFNSPTLKDNIEKFIFLFQRGLSTYLGINSFGIDIAANTRLNSRAAAMQIIQSSTFFELLFGHGYMTEWIDFPFLQAILDMGIIGGCVYILLQSVVLFSAITNLRNNNNLAFLFVKYFAVVGWMYNFYSGVPYGYYKYVHLIPLYYMVSYLKKQKIMQLPKYIF